MDNDEVEACHNQVRDAPPQRRLTSGEVRLIYELLVDRFEHLDMLSRSTSSPQTSERLKAEKVRIENVIRTICA